MILTTSVTGIHITHGILCVTFLTLTQRAEIRHWGSGAAEHSIALPANGTIKEPVT